MTPADVKAARQALGMTTAELKLALCMASDEGRSVRNCESGRNPHAAIPAPATALVRPSQDDGRTGAGVLIKARAVS